MQIMFKRQSQTKLRDSSLSCVPAHMLMRVWCNSFVINIALTPFTSICLALTTTIQNCGALSNLVLMLFLGNASVESGFSVNNDILVDNLHEESLDARRIMYDTIQTAAGMFKVEISKTLQQYVGTSKSSLR